MHLTRRALLITAGSAALVGCTSGAKKSTGPKPEPDPDAATLARRTAAAAELALAGRYEALISSTPALATRLTPLLEHHRKHVGALIPTGASTATSPTVAASATAAPVPPQKSALAELAAAERALSAQHVSALQDLPADLAMLLASLAAAAAAHAAELARR